MKTYLYRASNLKSTITFLGLPLVAITTMSGIGKFLRIQTLTLIP